MKEQNQTAKQLAKEGRDMMAAIIRDKRAKTKSLYRATGNISLVRLYSIVDNPVLLTDNHGPAMGLIKELRP